MRNYFIIDGHDSRDYGVYISGEGTFNSAEKELNLIPIPGRNGDLQGPGKRFKNIPLSYPAFIYADFKNNIAAFRAMLSALNGYVRLEDSYHPNEFRQVIFEGPFEPDVEPKNDAGRFDVTFNAKPQRFLKSGETVVTLNASGSITNPTLFDAQPLLRVYGKGTLGIGSQSVTITQADVYTDIDCAMMDAYKGTASKNAYVQLSNYNFPVLKAGVNNISLGSGITRVDITPRWWTV